MRLPSQAPVRRSRQLLVAVASVAALAVLQVPDAAFAGYGLHPTALTARLGAPCTYLPRRAEEDDSVLDVEAVEVESVDNPPSRASKLQGGDMNSVYDGAIDSPTYRKKVKATWYTVDKGSMTWENEMTGEKGEWNKEWEMPQKIYERDRPALYKEWSKERRKLLRKHGRRRLADGKWLHLKKLDRNPLTAEICGEKYRARQTCEPWRIERRKQQARARELEIKIRLEKEEKRVKRLQELGVWLGNPDWRPFLERQVPFEGKQKKRR
eukprot:TRINITY_DN4943_c0_g1_i1.p1 TRINITY_DN4943_c0_g1~~TRINITY_DN4943_c0_g1_i1.p1  ORF type:complete len:288 (-),score=59.54 TRINITY_DN4943_c0_g1_i1:93-893(-)